VVAGLPAEAKLHIAGAGVLAVVAGFFPVRIPGSKNSFVAGEIFIFLLLLLHGPAAATIAAAGEAAVGSFRSSKRWSSRIFSPASAAVAMQLAGVLLGALSPLLSTSAGLAAGWLLIVAMLVSIAHFTANALLVSTVLKLKRGERFDLQVFAASFGSVGITYAGSALIAALIHLTVEQNGMGVLVGALPVIAMLLATVHYFLRQQEAWDTMRRAQIEAAQREAEQAARHLAMLQDREAALRASEQRFHSAFTHASIGMALLSFDGTVLQSNAALTLLLGVSEEQLRSRRFAGFVLDAERGEFERQLAAAGAGDFLKFAIEVRCRHEDGSVVWTALHCSPFSEPGSATASLILQVQDVSARRRAEEGLQQLAFNDTLTGLPNRRRFQQLLAEAVARARSDPSQRYAVLFLDFDRFKLINDSLGHAAGDEFLVQVARRMQQRLRAHDVVARLGGDEFAILMHRLHDDEAAPALARRVLQALEAPFRLGGAEWVTSASIGITTSAVGYADAEDVLRDADIAMYRAKAGGKGRFVLFDSRLHAEVSDRLQLESDLRHAIAGDDLALAYQPLWDMGSKRLLGFEALARWTHEVRGPVAPDVFIPVAEESGLIMPLTDRVLTRACHQLRLWQLSHARFAELSMQVNLSGKDLAQPGLTERVGAALEATGVRPEHLRLELTENILMPRIEAVLPTLRELRGLGVGLSLDDFGSGYTSLAHLSDLPIDSLKIDRLFVQRLSAGARPAMIVRGIIELGVALGKSVVAEGIETPSQFDQLREMGCSVGQGYHLSRPLSPAQTDTLLSRVLHTESSAISCATSVLAAAVH
jgi:diguanylate cyclase (GGDEF)-like protein/PAS domain S-box-containing protein